jgi:urease accessory protein
VESKLSWLVKAGLLGLLSVCMNPVSAHTDSGAMLHFSTAFLHPWLGADHLMMMFAVGLWARSAFLNRVWLMPLCFWLAMAVGIRCPEITTSLGISESGILATLLIFGLCISCRQRLPLTLLLPMTAFAGLCHGAVHAVEVIANPIQAIALIGLLGSTAVVHLIGMFAGRLAQSRPRLQTATGMACVLVATVMA